MNKKILEIYNAYKAVCPHHLWMIWKQFYMTEYIKIWFQDFINHVYLDVWKDELHLSNSNFVKKMQKYFQNTPKIMNNIWYSFEMEEGYNFRVDWENIWTILLSWLWKFYFLLHKKDTEQEKEIIKYLESLWYEKVPAQVWETELDIIGNDFMPYDAWVEKAKERYKESYVDDDYYYICEMNGPDYPKDRVKDFEIYCKEEYEGPFKVSHLLLGENANWVMK